jgi:hypothetical protein
MAIIGSVLLLVHGSLQDILVTVLQAALLILAGLYLILRQKRAS